MVWNSDQRWINISLPSRPTRANCSFLGQSVILRRILRYTSRLKGVFTKYRGGMVRYQTEGRIRRLLIYTVGRIGMTVCFSDPGNRCYHEQGMSDQGSKRTNVGFSQGAGYDSRNKLKELLRKKQQQQRTQTEYINRWNERFEEEFGKRSVKPARSQTVSPTKVLYDRFQPPIHNPLWLIMTAKANEN